MNAKAPNKISYFTHEFSDRITRHGVGKTRVIMYKVLFMPPKFELNLPFKTNSRLRVEGEIADVPVRGAWMPVGDGRRYFIVSPEIKANTGLDVGDVVEMRFRVDDQDFVDIPKALEVAILSHDYVNEAWSKLTAGKKRMFTNHVASAKNPPTQQRRINEALTAISEGITIRDLQKRK